MSSVNNKRIAKNTLLLYARTFLIMLVSLYTSRIILKALGVENYGIYHVVGGLVIMFSMISGSMSAAISRFITYEIGKGNREKLNIVFSTSVYVLVALALIVFLLAEIIGIWFMETQMQIPEGRMNAARWVLHCSLLTFCINLLSIPYNACIIAHEKMGAFAYISVFDAVAKLCICYLLFLSPIDRLVFYAICMMAEAVIVRYIYSAYSRRHFIESRKISKFDKNIFKEIFSFAGWGFITNVNGHLNNQGVTMLINVFFGITFNAARGIANQVESAIIHFVNNFTTAFKPQIIKCYATSDIEGMSSLVFRAAKFSYFAMLLMMLPVICETDIILHTWLTIVPDWTVVFVKLSLIIGTFDCIGASCATACFATGKIRKYAIILGVIGLMQFPITWVLFLLGAPVVSTYYLYIVVKTFVLVARIYLLQDMVGIKMSSYFKKVIIPIIVVTFVSFLPSVVILFVFQQSLVRLLLSVVIGVLSVLVVSFMLGMTKGERNAVVKSVKTICASR